MSEMLLSIYLITEIFTYSVRDISSKNSDENINHSSLHLKGYKFKPLLS